MQRILPVLLLLLPLLGMGQVVNIENKRFDNDTARWAANVGFRFNVVENTQRSIDLGANATVQFSHDIHKVFFITDFNLNRVETNAFTNTGFQHVRYQRVWTETLSWEGYLQFQYNKPLRIDSRRFVGAGIRAELRNTELMRVAAGSSVMLEHELDRENDLEQFDARSSNYLSLAFKWEPHVQLTAVMYYQPVIADASDHRTAIEAQLRMRATRRFAFETRIGLQRDTEMAPGIPELNYRWQNAFTFLL